MSFFMYQGLHEFVWSWKSTEWYFYVWHLFDWSLRLTRIIRRGIDFGAMSWRTIYVEKTHKYLTLHRLLLITKKRYYKEIDIHIKRRNLIAVNHLKNNVVSEEYIFLETSRKLSISWKIMSISPSSSWININFMWIHFLIFQFTWSVANIL